MGLSQTDFELEDSKWLYQSNQNCVNTLDSKSIQDTERNMLELTLKLSSLSTKKLNVNLKKKKIHVKSLGLLFIVNYTEKVFKKKLKEEELENKKESSDLLSVLVLKILNVKENQNNMQHLEMQQSEQEKKKSKEIKIKVKKVEMQKEQNNQNKKVVPKVVVKHILLLLHILERKFISNFFFVIINNKHCFSTTFIYQ